ncbi:hypothetical protein B0H21DRAFT_781377 [Amylocystis lapponica]|nr:hypothetical protein B0H21DRAFT_781377 [Amylocystis lapponica]
MPRYKLVFFVPAPATQRVLQHLFAVFPAHVGRIGAYARCAFVARGTGQFVPLAGARPAVGADRVEVLVREAGGERADVARVVEELKKVHPYEEVAYDVYRLEDF